jgi:hypothetical protein
MIDFLIALLPLLCFCGLLAAVVMIIVRVIRSGL